MTREEFILKYRGRFLLLMTEAWAIRREDCKSLAMTIDKHALDIRKLMQEIWLDFNPPTEVAGTDGNKKDTGGQQAAR